MKTYIKIVLLTILTFASCTDVVEVDVPETDPRLVVEASIDWEKGTLGNEQMIKLSASKPYFDKNEDQIVTGASVKITNDSNGAEVVFVDQNNGEYTTDSFAPILNQSYTLEIIYNNETYIAKETMRSVTDIISVTQEIDKDELSITAEFEDPENEKNFYFGKFKDRNEILPELFYDFDKFTNGNVMEFEYYVNDDDDDDDERSLEGIVDFRLYGISERYYNYISLLTDQAESDGSPFSTTPAPLRGNCINTTNTDNNAFGYFRLSQTVTTSFQYSSK